MFLQLLHSWLILVPHVDVVNRWHDGKGLYLSLVSVVIFRMFGPRNPPSPLEILLLLKCRLVQPTTLPFRLNTISQYFSRLNYEGEGASLGNIKEREKSDQVSSTFFQEMQFCQGRVWDNKLYQVIKVCLQLFTLYNSHNTDLRRTINFTA